VIQVVVTPPQAPAHPAYPPAVRRQTRRRGCGLIGWLVSLTVIGVAVWLGNAIYRDPYFLINLIMPGPGAITGVFGGTGTGPGLFQDASGVAVDGQGTIYVSDKTTFRIQRFDAQGHYLGGWAWESSEKNGAARLAADRAGHVYLAWGEGLMKFDGATGALLGKFTSQADFFPDRFDDVAVLPDGSVLAAGNLISKDLVHYSPDGAVLGRIESPIEAQTGTSETETHIAVDGLGQIFLLGLSSSAVFRFTPDGKFVTRFGSQGAGDDQFDWPVEDIAVDNQSRVYVGDWNGVVVFDQQGRFLGRVPKMGFDWGTTPGEMAFNDQNDLFVTQGWQGKILKLALDLPQK
jgi:sugar lactone lactonase YvrE